VLGTAWTRPLLDYGGVLQAEGEKVWLDRLVHRGDEDIPLDLDLVITSDPAWWLNMGNGRGRSSSAGSGSVRGPLLIGNWYDTGVVLAALVARGADCWQPDCLIACTSVRLVLDNIPGSGASIDAAESSLRAVLGQVYHHDLTSACNLLVSLAALFEQHGLSWGCIAGTNTVELARDGSLGELVIEKETRTAMGVPNFLPAGIERPTLEGKVTYLEDDERAHEGRWTYPLFSMYACCLSGALDIPIARPNDND
jgi:hypothetical protein